MNSQVVLRQRKKYNHVFLISEVVLDLILLCINGFVLKWRITFGEKSHEHPHIPEERTNWLINTYLNLIFSALSIDLFFPVFYYFIKNKDFLLFYFLASFLLLGASFGMILPIEEELKLDSSLLFRHDLIIFYIFLSILLLLKFAFVFYYKYNF